MISESATLKSEILWKWTWGEALAGYLYESEQKFEESISLARLIDDSTSLLGALRDLGWTLGYQERYNEASQKFSESLEIVKKLGEDFIQDSGTGLGFWGAILTRQGEINLATEYLLQGLRIKEQLRDHRGILEQLVWLGRLYEVQQDFGKAQEYYNHSLRLRWCGRLYFDTAALIGLARIEYANGNYTSMLSLRTCWKTKRVRVQKRFLR